MFKKILITNRGEIAVRIARTCRELGIPTVAVYEALDQTCLHIRLADECVLLNSPRGLNDQDAILEIARAKGADAIHPGYSFLAENAEFVERCNEAGIAFIGPPPAVIRQASAKIDTLQRVRAAGFPTVECSTACATENDLESLHAEAARLGYPVVVKSCRGGRGRGERIVRAAEDLEHAVRRAQAEAQAVYGERHVFLEKAISPAHQIGAQIVADDFDSMIHLGEREGSLLHGNQKVLEESPAPCLNDSQREKLYATALAIARLLRVRGVVTIEFLVDARGEFYFTELKPRLVTDHPLTELRARIDLVREQIRLRAGAALGMTQNDVSLQGYAMSCRLYAQDPQQNFMPSPGRARVRFPNGPETRVDTYLYSGALVPNAYDPLFAKLSVWAATRDECRARLQRALQNLSITGIATNALWLEQLTRHADFARGAYSTETTMGAQTKPDAATLRDFAIAAALLYVRAAQAAQPTAAPQSESQWHRAARALPTNDE